MATALFEARKIDRRGAPALVRLSLTCAGAVADRYLNETTWMRVAPAAGPQAHGVVCIALMLQLHLRIAEDDIDPLVREFAARVTVPDLVELVLAHRCRFHETLAEAAASAAIRVLEKFPNTADRAERIRRALVK